MRFGVAVLALFSALATTALAHADTINYTLTSTASGNINNSQYFTNAAITVTGSYDTADIVDYGEGYYVYPTVTYTIDGVGSFTSIRSGDSIGTSSSGVLVLYNYGVIQSASAAYTTYDLSTAFGPIAGSGWGTSNWDQYSGGYVNFSSFSAITATFTVAPTPEPSSLLLLTTGLGAAAAFARRRFVQR